MPLERKALSLCRGRDEDACRGGVGVQSEQRIHQSKLGYRYLRGVFFQRKKIERPGIAVAGGNRGANEQTGYTTSSRHPAKDFGPFTGPYEEEIGTARLCGNVALTNPGK